MNKPQLAHHVELCFSVDDLPQSIEFYKKLGFEVYTGGVEQSYCSMKSDLLYISLFTDNFIEKEFGHPFILNYRGGNIDNIKTYLKEQKLEIDKQNILEQGTGNIIIEDLNGLPIFFDTSPDEERVDIE